MKIIYEICFKCNKDTLQLIGPEISTKGLPGNNEEGKKFGYLCMCGKREWDPYALYKEKGGIVISRALGKFIRDIW